MEFRQLRHFVAVVEQETLRAASKVVGLSQPALTRSIQNLEEDLKVKLLRRKGRRVFPTVVGGTFFSHAKLILNECRRAADAASLLQQGIEGDISIGIGPIFSNYIVDAAIARSTSLYPRLHIKVVEGLYEDLIDRLQAGALDLAVLNFATVKVPKGLVRGDPLVELSSSAFVRSSHPLLRKRKVTPADTVEQKWLVVDQPLAMSFHGRQFEDLGLPVPKETVTTNSLVLIRSLLLLDDFITVIPQELVRDELERGELKRLNLPEFAFNRKAGIISRENHIQSPAAMQFVATLKAVCSELSGTARGRKSTAS
jgi:DNA-binding transcriptional LysR family regulator